MRFRDKEFSRRAKLTKIYKLLHNVKVWIVQFWTKCPPFISLGIVVCGIILFVILFQRFVLGYTYWAEIFGEGYTDSTGAYHPGKTFWDLAELLIVPIFLAAGAAYINYSEKEKEKKIANDKIEEERRIAKNYQMDCILKSYQDEMSNLLLDKYHPLRFSEEKDDVRSVAMVKTLTTLSQLDAGRKGKLISSLTDQKLVQSIDGYKPVLDLTGADLSGIHLLKAHLSGINLSGINLSEALLMRAELNGAIISGSILYKAYLMGADMRGAVLTDSLISESDISGAKLEGAIMPDGKKYDPIIHDEWLRSIGCKR